MPSMIVCGEDPYFSPHAVGLRSLVKGRYWATVEGSCFYSSRFPLTDPRS